MLQAVSDPSTFPEGWLREGGFAFAAIIFALALVVVTRSLVKFFNERERFIDRMLVRLEGNEAEHARIADAMNDNSLAIKDLASAHTKAIEIIATSTNTAMQALTAELNATRLELIRGSTSRRRSL